MHEPHIAFITGASGAGKSTALDLLKLKLSRSSTVCLHFDSIGVPSVKEMIRDYGSPTEWQKAMTYQWIDSIMSQYQNKNLVILEGQVNCSFILAAFKRAGVKRYKIILMHCDHAIRHRRLTENRLSPSLVNDEMDNWSEFLKNQAAEMRLSIIDTSDISIDEAVQLLKKAISPLE